MKIAFIMEDAQHGGVEVVTYRLIKALKRISTSIDISVFFLQKEGELLSAYESLCECQCHTSFIKMRDAINLERPDIAVFTKGGLSRFAFFLDARIKTMVVQHTPILLPGVSKVRNTVRLLMALVLYRSVDKVITVSDGILHDLQAKLKLPKGKLQRIYNPVLDKNIIAEANETIEEQDYFVCVGRLHFQKGYDYLLHALAIAKQSMPNLRAVFIGDGDLREELEQLAISLGVENNVVFKGYRANPYPYILNAKAFLLSSRWEGLPTVLVEAAFLGTPLIAFDCHFGPAELTQQGKFGSLIKVGDTRGLANAMLALEAGEKPPCPDVSAFEEDYSAKQYREVMASLCQ